MPSVVGGTQKWKMRDGRDNTMGEGRSTLGGIQYWAISSMIWNPQV